MCVSVGIIVGARGFRRWEGIWEGTGQVVEGVEEINNDGSSSATVEKELRKAGEELESCRMGGGYRGDVSYRVPMYGSTFSLK
ncbi:hypothetical protein FKM82_022712 [Ascaphus truei]